MKNKNNNGSNENHEMNLTKKMTCEGYTSTESTVIDCEWRSIAKNHLCATQQQECDYEGLFKL